MLIHAAGQRRATGEIDLDQIIGAIAANNPLEVLPRQSVFTLREGVQLLCDSGPGMEPFALDVAQIADAVRAVAGRDRVSLAYFLGCHCAVWFDGETAGTNVIGHPLQVNLFLRCRISACFGQQVADELRSRQRNGSILICCFGDAALR